MRLSHLMNFAVLPGMLLAAAVQAAAPNFSPSVYGDGVAWGTKGNAALPAPNEYNRQSFDALYVITNSNNPQGQLAVSEAAPGNPDYNGGRWFTHTVEWTAEGFMAHGGIVPVLTSYDEIQQENNAGYLVITPGSFPDGPPVYFQCPLLPVK
ncbi:MAG TPA: hypothetical protein VET88_12245 [Gammaproteobacteria bacterium]|nr:hypothetical protein [Gammaproteobacteria bacterium]